LLRGGIRVCDFDFGPGPGLGFPRTACRIPGDRRDLGNGTPDRNARSERSDGGEGDHRFGSLNAAIDLS